MKELRFRLNKNKVKQYFSVALAFALALSVLGMDSSTVFANQTYINPNFSQEITTDEETSGEEISIGEISEGQISDGQISNGEISEGQITDGQISEGEISDEDDEEISPSEVVVASGYCGYSKTSGTQGENLTWSLYKNGALIISGSGKMNEYGYSSAPWYKYNDKIYNIIINSGIENITSNAFWRCSNFVSIEIPDSVTKISTSAFKECGHFYIYCSSTSWTASSSTLKSYCVTEKNITGKAGKNLSYSFDRETLTLTFTGNGSLYSDFKFAGTACAESVDFSEWKFDQFPSFKNYYRLKSITVPDGIKSVPENAFYGCTSLENISLPESLTRIEDRAFLGCRGLKNIILPENLTYIGCEAFENCASLTEINIPKGITAIGSNTFYNCYCLQSIDIPNGVKNIESSAFYGCKGLSSISLPQSVTSIADEAFEGCSSLSCITIPSGVTRINYNLFAGCTGLTDVYIQGYKLNIDSDVFPTDHIITIHGYSYAKKYIDNLNVSYLNYTCLCDENIHYYTNTVATRATTTKKGKYTTQCAECGSYKSSSVIYPAKTFTLSKSTFTYTGKAQKPTIKIKDSQGNTIATSNYSVSYSSGCKNVGTYTAKITFKNYYSGTVSKTFTIVPKGTSLKSVSASSKGFTVKWGKQSTQTTGYQIQYSTNSKFFGAKTATISSISTTSYKASKLTSKKKYYVRIRTFKTVGGKKIYSSWSSAKSITTKK